MNHPQRAAQPSPSQPSAGAMDLQVLPEVVAEGVGDVGEPVGVGAGGALNVGGEVAVLELLEDVIGGGHEGLDDVAEERDHSEAGVLELREAHGLEAAAEGGVSEAEGVEVGAAGVEVADGVLLEEGVDETAAVGLGEAHGEHLDGEHVVERGVALGAESPHLAGEDGVDGGAVVGGAESTGLEPGGAGADLTSPGAGAAHHSPAAVDELGLGELGDLVVVLALSPVGPESLVPVAIVDGLAGLDVLVGLGDDGLAGDARGGGLGHDGLAGEGGGSESGGHGGG
mmetsp:Transcript_39686/g.126811  ORF Transcript_39686/g.126811 Transcript_39686/m.126811 type:complete len:284 (+) Transcript_39686:54-905(+)